MNHKIFFSITVLFLLSISSLRSQNLANLQGTVQSSTGSIAGASIRLLNTNLSTQANEQGLFNLLNIPSGQYRAQVSAVGYATITQAITLAAGTNTVDFRLAESATQLSEVVVSAQKKEEDLQRVPLSITALSAKQVQEYRLWNIRDLTAIAPNLFSSDPGDNRNLLSIRGITTTSYDPAVATYIDGVNQFSLDTYLPELLDIERIEVLRGPQGTLYGRNAMGGVVNIITRQPGNTTSGFVAAEVGNYGQQRYSAGIRTPLVQDKLYLGVAGLFRKQDGFYTNTFDNSEFDRQRVGMGNYYLKYLATPNLTLTLNAKHSANRNQGAFPLVSSIDQALASPFEVNQNSVGEMVDNTFNTSFTANYAGSAFSLTSQTAYQSNYRYYRQPLDGDFSPIDGVSIVNNYGRDWNRVRVLTQEIRVTSPASASSPVKWLAGAYGFANDNPVKQGIYFGEDAEMVGAPFPFFTSINTNDGESYGLALFGQGSYQISPRLELTAGLRYDYEHRKQMIRGEFQPEGGDLLLVQPDTSSKASFKAVSPKASLSFYAAENTHLYASYSRGFRAGGITQLSSDPAQPPLFAFDPEYSNNYEIGLKTAFLENSVTANISAFYTQVTDAQVPTLILPEAIVVTRNVGELESKGVELELNAALAKGLEASYSFGLTDATYTNLIGNSDGEEVDLNGNKQVFTPDVTSMLTLQYGYDLSKTRDLILVLRGEWRYLGRQYFDLANQLEQPGYSVFNARAGVRTNRFEIFLWGRNLTDERYLDYVYNFGAARLGNPATYGVSARYDF